MPRPPLKRTKLNHPTPSKRVAIVSKISPLAELQQKLADKPVGRVLTDSDDSDKLVTSKRNGRNRGGIPRKEIYASGGVGLGDEPGAHRSQKKQSQLSQTVDAQNVAGKENTVATTRKGSGGGAAKPAVNDRPQTVDRRNPPTHSPPIVPGSTAVSRATTRLQNTPARDTSILGTIKPRRRQPSILHLLGNNDSSNIEDEDENDFLPNDESTPLQHSTALATTSTPNSSLSHLSTTSRKRKLSPPITFVRASQQREESPRGHSRDVDAADAPYSEPQLLPQQRSGAALLRATPRPDNADIMAPPLSSSPLKSPAKSIVHSPVKKATGKSRKQPLAPSTSELRALMPTRRQRKGRLRTQPANEFDIPADTSNDDSDGHAGPTVNSDDEDLSFRAETRSRKSKATTGKKAKPARKPTNARVRGREKSTISPTKLVTPLKRPPAQKSAAKSSLSQQPPGHGSATTTSTKGNAKAEATYSSLRRHRRHHDVSGDKENRPVDSSDAFSGGEEGSRVEGIEDSLELSIEDVEKPKPTKEIRSLVKKFADVDEWEMEFEDVSLGGNSSPNRR